MNDKSQKIQMLLEILKLSPYKWIYTEYLLDEYEKLGIDEHEAKTFANYFNDYATVLWDKKKFLIAMTQAQIINNNEYEEKYKYIYSLAISKGYIKDNYEIVTQKYGSVEEMPYLSLLLLVNLKIGIFYGDVSKLSKSVKNFSAFDLEKLEKFIFEALYIHNLSKRNKSFELDELITKYCSKNQNYKNLSALLSVIKSQVNKMRKVDGTSFDNLSEANVYRQELIIFQEIYMPGNSYADYESEILQSVVRELQDKNFTSKLLLNQIDILNNRVSELQSHEKSVIFYRGRDITKSLKKVGGAKNVYVYGEEMFLSNAVSLKDIAIIKKQETDIFPIFIYNSSDSKKIKGFVITERSLYNLNAMLGIGDSYMILDEIVNINSNGNIVNFVNNNGKVLKIKLSAEFPMDDFIDGLSIVLKCDNQNKNTLIQQEMALETIGIDEEVAITQVEGILAAPQKQKKTRMLVDQSRPKKIKSRLKVVGIIVCILLGLCIIVGIFSSKETQTVSEQTNIPEHTQAMEESSEDLMVYELYSMFQDNEIIPFTLNDKATAFLKEYSNLFPASTWQEVPEELVAEDLEYRHLAKNSDKYGDKLMIIPEMQVVQIEETNIGEQGYFTEMNVIDDNGQQHYIFYNGELADVFEGDVICGYALPLGTSSFDNTDGGKTIVAVYAGSYIGNAEMVYQDILAEYQSAEETTVQADNQYQEESLAESPTEYILPYSNTRILTASDLSGLSQDDLRIAKNEIYARHGRKFQSEDLQRYFEGKSWYQGTISAESFNENVLSQIEKDNVAFIASYQEQPSQTKNIYGAYHTSFGSEGGADLEIMYYSGDDVSYVEFSGSYIDAAGGFEGYLVQVTNNVYHVVDEYTGEIEALLEYNGLDDIVVTEYSVHGGVRFPGFSGTYTRTNDYSNAG